MDEANRQEILSILNQHRIMTIATLRPDGWPQATTVGYVNEGMAIYFLCGLDSQKAANIGHDNRVSVTIDRDEPQIMEIKGLSMAAHAIEVTNKSEAARVLALMPTKYPEQKSFPLEMPKPGDVKIYRLEPKVISVLDYTQGFGHTDLVAA